MEFIRYVNKDDINDLVNHATKLSEFIERSYIEIDEEAKYDHIKSDCPEDWLSNIKVTITIEDVDITILNAAIPTILSMENVINDSI